MASVRRHGKKVSRKTWHASGYRRNPVRHRRRRSNPFGLGGIGGEILSLGKQTVAVMAGRYLGRTISGMIPTPASSSPTTQAALEAGKGVLVAILLKKFGRKIVSAELADALAVGALLNPLGAAITTLSPSAGSFLSGGPMGFATFPGGMASYARPGVGSYGGTDSDDSTYVGSYSQNAYEQ
jgi:hypothetical protein